ncbi:hypothetical protein DL93DRAFT_790444 [Clavulina sp. PMI_390]|nr:hypothetical protein DL93DRAFT_790444 [Clavulina sp. PMI_390]
MSAIRVASTARLSLAARQAPQFVARRSINTSAAKGAQAAQVGTSRPGSQGAKLPFRFGPNNVPIELWPMGVILGAGLLGGSFAIYRHLTHDDLRHHSTGTIDSMSHEGKKGISATEYTGDGNPVTDN